jgi:hypothetical protein
MRERQIKDALLERYAAGEGDPELRAKIEATLAGSEPDRARLDELRADSAAFLTAHPPGPLVARFEEHRRTRRSRTLLKILAPVLALTAAAVAFALFGPSLPVDRQGIRLAVFNAREPGAPVGPVDVVSPGDAVRFLLAGRSMGFIAVLGRDAAGAVRVYVPKEGLRAERYDPKAPMLPDVAQVGSGREEIIGLFSPQPFELAPVVEALRQHKPLEGLLPAGSVSATVPLQKSPALNSAE